MKRIQRVSDSKYYSGFDGIAYWGDNGLLMPISECRKVIKNLLNQSEEYKLVD